MLPHQVMVKPAIVLRCGENRTDKTSPYGVCLVRPVLDSNVGCVGCVGFLDKNWDTQNIPYREVFVRCLSVSVRVSVSAWNLSAHKSIRVAPSAFAP